MNKRQRKKLAKRKLRKLNMPYFTPCERWNLFHTFSVYIAAGLKEFLSYKLYGMPQEFSDVEEEMAEGNSEIKESKEFYEELSHEVKNMIAEREQQPRFDGNAEQSTEMRTWRGTIEKMVWSFEQLRDDCPDSLFSKWHDKQFWSLLEKGIKPMELTKEPNEDGLTCSKI